MSLWTSDEIVEVTGGKCNKAFAVDRLSMDSRDIQKGDLFLAFPGTQSDGHKYVAQALSAGAHGAIVNHVPEDVPDDAPLIIVEDTQKALEDLACAARSRLEDSVILAITGSVGKTSTKEMLACALSALGKTHAAQGSYNNFRGVPFTLANMPRDTEFGVFEFGMNHGGEIAPLSQMVRPNIAIITTVEAVHIENFESEQGIADAKTEIFKGVEYDHEFDLPGIAILNHDNRWFDYLKEKAEDEVVIDVHDFGTKKGVDARLISYENNKVKITIHEAYDDTVNLEFDFYIPGTHMAMNATAVLMAIFRAGLDVQKAAAALSNLRPYRGRGEQHLVVLGDPDNPVTVIDESYNASPVAVKAALKVMSELPCKGRRIFVMGDMYELGEGSTQMHVDLAQNIIDAHIDIFYGCGQNVQKLMEALPKEIQGQCLEDPHEIATIVADHIEDGDMILVKGSRGGGSRPRMYETVAAILEKGKAS